MASMPAPIVLLVSFKAARFAHPLKHVAFDEVLLATLAVLTPLSFGPMQPAATSPNRTRTTASLRMDIRSERADLLGILKRSRDTLHQEGSTGPEGFRHGDEGRDRLWGSDVGGMGSGAASSTSCAKRRTICEVGWLVNVTRI